MVGSKAASNRCGRGEVPEGCTWWSSDRRKEANWGGAIFSELIAGAAMQSTQWSIEHRAIGGWARGSIFVSAAWLSFLFWDWDGGEAHLLQKILGGLPSWWPLKHLPPSYLPSLCRPSLEAGAWVVGSRHHEAFWSEEGRPEHRMWLCMSRVVNVPDGKYLQGCFVNAILVNGYW